MSHTPRKKIRVLVVDDSALVRQAISAALARDPELEVVGTACDPYVAREKIAQLDPDVLTLDLEMPRMDGLTFLRILMEYHPMPVVVVSSLTQQGSPAAVDAIEAGAVDVLAKPDGTMSIGTLADKLAFHVKAAAAAAPRLRKPMPAAVPPTPVPRQATVADPQQLVVIGASTGGVEALRQIVPQFPAGLPPIAIVQHISAFFSRAVADRLASISGIQVREAGDNEPLRPGECVIAPGDFHLAVDFRVGGYVTRLLQTPPIHHCRPAVDVLFRSAAEAAGHHLVAVLLTGMGSDGALGMQAIRAAGGTTIAQDEATSVVYGMPRAAVELGVVDHIVPLDAIAKAVVAGLAAQASRGPAGNTSP
jgi:two-component system, chemotaxis family, protein-glutamate methylesterase/glutaminase